VFVVDSGNWESFFPEKISTREFEINQHSAAYNAITIYIDGMESSDTANNSHLLDSPPAIPIEVPVRRTAVLNLVAFMGALALAVLALELGVRWVNPQPLQQLQLDDELYVVNRPGARFTHAHGSEYAIPIKYNSWGFRGPVPTRDVPSCTTRIV